MEEKQKRTSVVADVMLKLKELIISDEYHVGDKIPTEAELAQRFGIGRSSIREAIKVFQYLGIVETRVPKGTFLCKDNTMAAELLTWFSILEKKTIYEILEFREVFEQRGLLNILDNYKTNPKLAQLCNWRTISSILSLLALIEGAT
jgi:GntR family transcriptional repressor for pyruvate dehydrogenase complex